MSNARRTFMRMAVAIAVVLALSACASGYYHFVHYSGRTAPFVQIPEKFDLRALLNNTLFFYVSAEGPEKLYSGKYGDAQYKDNVEAVLSQLRLAGATWNNVSTSALRIAWGGVYAADTPQNTPHVELIFDELPPGLLAMGGPTARGDLIERDGSDAFVPILRSSVVLNKDLSSSLSFSSGFYLTAVHEMGHALGLQHTATSSVMSTSPTRASTKASVLGSDDVAALSLLYPNGRWVGRFGSISGRVTLAGEGVHLASVVALQPHSQAVSALTNPDGTYKIDGLAPGNYYLYVHALPPSVQSDLGPSEIVLPVDPDGKTFAAGRSFATQFYPGTKDPKDASVLTVRASQTTADVDFSVTARTAPSLYGVSTYSFPGDVAVKPAYLPTTTGAAALVVAWGQGLMTDSGPVAGLGVTVLGGGMNLASNGIQSYSADDSFLQLTFALTPFSTLGPQHLVFSTPGEVFVLPSAITLVNHMPPALASLESSTDKNGSLLVTVHGSDLTSSTRILFDGEQAKTLSVDADGASMVVAPPPAAQDYVAAVTALNSDGQTSLFLAQPLLYTYPSGPSDAAAVTLSQNSQYTGTEAMVEITAANMTFQQDRTTAGFGSSDVVARRLWVVSPTRLRVNVWVAPGAQASDTTITVGSGLQTATIPNGFHIRTSTDATPTLGSDLANTDKRQYGVYPGSTATLPVANLPSSATVSSVTLKLNDTQVAVTALDANKVTFVVPESFTPGTVVARLGVPDVTVAPVFVTIRIAPPEIVSITANGVAIDETHPAKPGARLVITAEHLGDGEETVSHDRIRLSIGGLNHALNEDAQPVPDKPKLHTLNAVLGTVIDDSDAVPVVLTFDGRASLPFNIGVKGE